jgi:hypothetical protein
MYIFYFSLAANELTELVMLALVAGDGSGFSSFLQEINPRTAIVMIVKNLVFIKGFFN